MATPRVSRRQVITGIAAAGVLGALGQGTSVVAEASGVDPNTRIRWDLINVVFAPLTLSAGGWASATAIDGSMITMTGSGIFIPALPTGVTGGGTWKVTAADGTASGSGTYDVTGFASFVPGPGSFPGIDLIGHAENISGGLAVLTIGYSDGDTGVLIVSCDPPVGGPANVFEGIRASKSYVMFWNGMMPMNNVNGNRTVFHIGQASPYFGPGSWYNAF